MEATRAAPENSQYTQAMTKRAISTARGESTLLKGNELRASGRGVDEGENTNER